MNLEPPASPFLPALDRRGLLKSSVLGAGLLATPLAAQTGTAGFTHGVASGEPGADSVLLWTRYHALQDVPLDWEVSVSLDFARPVAGGTVIADPARDGCVKPVATGLEPGRWYYYRFRAPDGSTSDIGRTRTLPQGRADRFRMAVFSCSNLPFGWFNAYAHAAEADAFDLVVHTGDYLYEYPDGAYPSADQRLPARMMRPQGETVALADYRLRHASYRSDPDLRRLTQLYPMIAGWDDHESANDSWEGGAENHQPEREGDWGTRKAAATRAYREWMPVSDEPWAAYEVGDLATLFRLETRLTARSRPPSFAEVLRGSTGPDDMAARLGAFRQGDYADPARTMLGDRQERWLADGMAASKRSGTIWQVLAQQVLMGSLSTPAAFIDALTDEVPPALRERLTASAVAARAGLPLNMDAWDGYPAARERVLAAAREADANLVVLAGDTHNAWGFELDHAGEAAGVEFGGQSVTSPGFDGYLSAIDPASISSALVEGNPQLAYARTAGRGYMAVELTRERASCEWRFLDTIRQRSTRLSATHRMTAPAGANAFA